MSKCKLVFLTICVLLLFCQPSVFASFIDNEYTNMLIVTNDSNNNLGAGYTSLNISFTSTTPESDKAAIYITGNSTVTLNENLTSITTSAANVTHRYGIGLKGDYSGLSSLTVATDLFTINHNVKFGDAIHVGKRAALTFNGSVKITTNHEYAGGITVTGDESTLNITKSLDITTTETFGVAVNLNGVSQTNVGSNFTISTVGSAGIGLRMMHGASLTVKGNSEIEVKGEYAHGAYLMTNNEATFKGDLAIKAMGDHAMGININDSTLKVEGNLDVETHGNQTIDSDYVFAVFITGYSNRSTLIVEGTTTLSTEKDDGYALCISGSNDLILKGKTTLMTIGNDAYAIYMNGNNSTNFHDELVITTSGTGSNGVFIGSSSNKNEITVKGEANIATTGEDAAALDIRKNGIITFEKFANINTSNTGSAYGVFISSGGTIKFNAGARIETTNADAIVFNGIDKSDSVFNDVYAKSGNGFVLSNASENNLEVSFTGKSEIHGYIQNHKDSLNNFGTITLTLSDKSLWEGRYFNSNEGKLYLVLEDKASWIVNEADSLIHTLTMGDDSKVEFSHSASSSSFNDATIENLSGQGIFVLNVDMSLSGNGNTIHINNGSGTFKLAIKDFTSGQGGAQSFTVITLDQITNNFEMSLSAGNKVRLGAYSYFLEASPDFLTWSLMLGGVDDGVINESENSLLGLNEFAKSVDATLSDELLNTKKQLWAVVGCKLQNLRDLPLDSAVRQDIYSMVAGIKLYENNYVHFNFFLGLNVGDQTSNDILKATMVAFTYGLNALYSKDDFNLSGYVRSSHYFYALDIIDTPSELLGSAKTFGISASLQAMNKFYISNSDFYLAPKGKISYTHISGFTHNFGPFEIGFSTAYNLVSWLGVNAGYGMETDQGTFGIYFEAGWIHDFYPEITVTIEDDSVLTLGKNRFEAGLGVNIETPNGVDFSFEYKYAFSKNLIEPLKLKLAASTTF